MTTTSIPTLAPRPRLLWLSLALVVGGSLGTAFTLVATDDGAGPTSAPVTESVPAASVTDGRPSVPVSPDAAERWVADLDAAVIAGCTQAPVSADAAERCLNGSHRQQP